MNKYRIEYMHMQGRFNRTKRTATISADTKANAVRNMFRGIAQGEQVEILGTVKI